LRESENKAQFTELLFDTEEAKVIGIDDGEFFRGVLQSKGKDANLGAFDVFGEIGTGAFHFHARLFSWNDSGWVLKPVKYAVVNLLHDVIDSNGGTGILEAMAAMITGCGRKQGAIGGQEVEAQKPQVLDNRNESMKDLLVESFSNANPEIGKGSLTRDAILPNACQPAVVASSFGIVKNQAEVLDGPDSIEVAKQIEKEKRDGVIARPAEDGIGIGSNRANEGKVDNGSDQLRDAAANGTVVIDVNEFLAKFIMGKPTGLFFREGLTVPTVDKRIDLSELSDKIGDSKAGGFAHLKAPEVSREGLRLSKKLPGNLFLFAQTSHRTPQIQTKASDSSLSTNAGSTALRSLSCA
jgi:hypothetical protein